MKTVESCADLGGHNFGADGVCIRQWCDADGGEDQADEVDLPTFLEQLAGQAAGSNPFEPSPAVAGTFAMYAHRHADTGAPTGGIVIVMKVDEGPMKGTHRAPIPAGMIRMMMALAGGGGKLSALKAGFTGRRRDG